MSLREERQAYVASQSDADLLATWDRYLSTGLRSACLAELNRRGLWHCDRGPCCLQRGHSGRCER